MINATLLASFIFQYLLRCLVFKTPFFENEICWHYIWCKDDMQNSEVLEDSSLSHNLTALAGNVFAGGIAHVQSRFPRVAST